MTRVLDQFPYYDITDPIHPEYFTRFWIVSMDDHDFPEPPLAIRLNDSNFLEVFFPSRASSNGVSSNPLDLEEKEHQRCHRILRYMKDELQLDVHQFHFIHSERRWHDPIDFKVDSLMDLIKEMTALEKAMKVQVNAEPSMALVQICQHRRRLKALIFKAQKLQKNSNLK